MMKKSNKMPPLHLHRALRQVSSVNTATSSFNELQVHNTHKVIKRYDSMALAVMLRALQV